MIGFGLGLAAVIVLAIGAVVTLGTKARRSDTLLWIADLFGMLSFTLDERIGGWAFDRRHAPIFGRLFDLIEKATWRAAKVTGLVGWFFERRALGGIHFGGTYRYGLQAASPVRQNIADLNYELGYDDGWDAGYNRAQYDAEREAEELRYLAGDYGLTDADLDALLGV